MTKPDYWEDLAPWYIILWRMIWIIPTQTCRFGMLFFYAIGWGFEKARSLYEDTK